MNGGNAENGDPFVDLVPAADQKIEGLIVALPGGVLEVDEVLPDLVVDGVVEGRVVHEVLDGPVGAGAEQVLHLGEVAVEGGEVQGRVAVAVDGVHDVAPDLVDFPAEILDELGVLLGQEEVLDVLEDVQVLPGVDSLLLVELEQLHLAEHVVEELVLVHADVVLHQVAAREVAGREFGEAGVVQRVSLVLVAQAHQLVELLHHAVQLLAEEREQLLTEFFESVLHLHDVLKFTRLRLLFLDIVKRLILRLIA